MNLKLPFLLGCCLLVATAYHNYGGRCEELNNIQQKRPDKELVFTETSIGLWNDERNQERRLMEDMREGGCKGADVKGLMYSAFENTDGTVASYRWKK